MTLKVLTWIMVTLGLFAFALCVVAFLSPLTYLKIYAGLGFGPASLPWVIAQAHEGLIQHATAICRAPVLLSWHGSFGGGPVLPDGEQQPPPQAFRELVLINSGNMSERTQQTLDAMAAFNVDVLRYCFKI